MLTGNLRYKMPFAAFRLTYLIPDMARNLIKERGAEKGDVDRERSVRARVNWGQWIWDCECGGAEFAWDEGLGMCRNCFNSKSGHRYRLILFPRIRAAIELLLINRPFANRNWFPGESLSKLRVENVVHKEELI